MTDDAELLRRYAEEGSEAAFTEWVQRHLGLVYGAALRRLGGDVHGAADVAQRVFVQAAREARVLARHASVTGWLYTTTRNAALNLMRDEQRRRQREQSAHADGEILSAAATEPPGEWERLRPVLDAAMDELGETDREAVLLRFFEGRAFAEVGRRLQVSENTARMRVERALDKLHAVLARRGVTSTTAALGVVLANQAGAAAAVPAGLAGSVTSAAFAGAAATTTTGGGLLWSGVFGFMSSTKMAVTVGGALLACALIGTATWEYRQAATRRADAEAEAARLAALAGRIREVESQAAAARREAAEWAAKLADAKAATAKTATASVDAVPTTPPKPAGTWDSVAEGRELMKRHPEVKRAVVARADAITRFGFEPMFRELALTPQQIDGFIALMREQSMVGAPMGPRGESYSLLAGNDIPFSEMDGRLRELLGDANYERLPEYFRLRDARTLAARWAGGLTFSDAPATAAQTEGLVRLLMTTAMPPGETKVGPFDWNAILARAPGVLGAAQLPALAALRPKTSGGGK